MTAPSDSGVSAHEGGIVITGAANIERARMITIRSGLGLEVRGLKMSRGRSMRVLANELMGTNIRTARKTYEAFNTWLVETHGLQDKPLNF